MATPQWTGRQSLAQPNINPTAAIAGASQAFGNITDTLQKEEMAKQQEAYRQQQLAQQNDQFSQQQGLQQEKFLFDKGAADRATQARLAEEARQKSLAADRFRIFNAKASELDNAQLDSFSMNPETFAALKNSGLNDQQIAELEGQAKQKNSDLFLDRNKTVAGLMEYIASTGEDPGQYAPLFESYKMKNGMGGVNEGAADFAEKLALANVRASRSGGSGSSGGGGGSTSDANFMRNVGAINDEELFRNGSDAWYKDWFPGEKTKVYKQDVTRIAEHALATTGIRPMYIAQAIKADMDEGQTPYNLADIATNPDDKNYQGILAAASLMQNAGNGSSGSGSGSSGSVFNSPAPGELGSAEFAMQLNRGYAPVNKSQLERSLLDMAKSNYPQVFNSSKPSGTSTTTAKNPAANVISEVLGTSQKPSAGGNKIFSQEDKSAILQLAKNKVSSVNLDIGNTVVGPNGQLSFAPSTRTDEQKELASLLKVAEKPTKPLVEMPNTPEFKLFPEKWKDPNPKIREENAKTEKAKEEAIGKIFKILEGKKPEKVAEQLKETPVEKVLSQNDIIRERNNKRSADLAKLIAERQQR